MTETTLDALALQAPAGEKQVLTVFESAARTATPTSEVYESKRARGVDVVINCTAATSSPSVVFTIVGIDPVSGATYTVLASAAITGTGATRIRVYPGETIAANLVANDVLPLLWKITAVHADADSITYSVSAVLLP
jgi:hypothetical protein